MKLRMEKKTSVCVCIEHKVRAWGQFSQECSISLRSAHHGFCREQTEEENYSHLQKASSIQMQTKWKNTATRLIRENHVRLSRNLLADCQGYCPLCHLSNWRSLNTKLLVNSKWISGNSSYWSLVLGRVQNPQLCTPVWRRALKFSYLRILSQSVHQESALKSVTWGGTNLDLAEFSLRYILSFA